MKSLQEKYNDLCEIGVEWICADMRKSRRGSYFRDILSKEQLISFLKTRNIKTSYEIKRLRKQDQTVPPTHYFLKVFQVRVWSDVIREVYGESSLIVKPPTDRDYIIRCCVENNITTQRQYAVAVKEKPHLFPSQRCVRQKFGKNAFSNLFCAVWGLTVHIRSRRARRARPQYRNRKSLRLTKEQLMDLLKSRNIKTTYEIRKIRERDGAVIPSLQDFYDAFQVRVWSDVIREVYGESSLIVKPPADRDYIIRCCVENNITTQRQYAVAVKEKPHLFPSQRCVRQKFGKNAFSNLFCATGSYRNTISQVLV